METTQVMQTPNAFPKLAVIAFNVQDGLCVCDHVYVCLCV